MKIYTVERVFDDGFENIGDCVCSTVDLNVAIEYINSNPLRDTCYSYLVHMFDGFTGKLVNHIRFSCYQVRKGITKTQFEEAK